MRGARMHGARMRGATMNATAAADIDQVAAAAVSARRPAAVFPVTEEDDAQLRV